MHMIDLLGYEFIFNSFFRDRCGFANDGDGLFIRVRQIDVVRSRNAI